MSERTFNADEPLAYFLTWTSYGTWLPGDERGWWHVREFREPYESIEPHPPDIILAENPASLADVFVPMPFPTTLEDGIRLDRAEVHNFGRKKIRSIVGRGTETEDHGDGRDENNCRGPKRMYPMSVDHG